MGGVSRPNMLTRSLLILPEFGARRKIQAITAMKDGTMKAMPAKARTIPLPGMSVRETNHAIRRPTARQIRGTKNARMSEFIRAETRPPWVNTAT